MADTVTVDPQALIASSGVAKNLAEEVAKPVKDALTSATTASGQLAGWSIAQGLGKIGSDWTAPLDALRKRLSDTSANLQANADAHAHNEQATAGAWSQQKAAQ
ncbi:hypothetical protein P3T27_000225 [Kitasatospora sp. MAA19]|uniref:hypothetical protein n=1 Tax=Kitasatospora sp. MAA19 TaxID=3035090 RepID=UPI0024744DA3|nr:hypothetical protein [Kitasatospora sp. MAA19]MDH6703544.1 hypothetical protein [Kitasatospora sp. MAA19]